MKNRLAVLGKSLTQIGKNVPLVVISLARMVIMEMKRSSTLSSAVPTLEMVTSAVVVVPNSTNPKSINGGSGLPSISEVTVLPPPLSPSVVVQVVPKASRVPSKTKASASPGRALAT